MLQLTHNGKILVTEPITVPITDGITGIIDQVTIPAGEVSDGYTIPRILWAFVGHPFGQKHQYPALVHDYLCRTARDYRERVLADAKFFVLLHRYGVSRWKIPFFYIAVRLCGRFMWFLRDMAWIRSSLLVLMATLVTFLLILTAAHGQPAPPRGWTTEATVTNIVDGDTIDVEIRRTLRVRLLDCWAPETRDPGGPESTAYLRSLLIDPDVTLWVPVDSRRVSDIWTFGRVLGHVWSKADADRPVSALQVEAGHATKEKQ
jgi:endonuclease YncB( thermonuclease family)